MTDDLSRYGKVRKATIGEIPTHLAMDDIRSGDHLIVHATDMTKQQAQITHVVYPKLRFDISRAVRYPRHLGKARYVSDMADALVYTFTTKAILERIRAERAYKAKKKFLFWVIVIMAILFVAAFYVDHFTTLTTITSV